MTDAAAPEGPLGQKERDFLRDLARRCVEAAARSETPPDTAALAREAGLDPAGPLGVVRGAFVTLTRGGALRGCIGTIEGIEPLHQAVADAARSATVGDPRFAPVTSDETPDLEIEVSALTPLRPVTGPEDIVIGEHGVLLELDGRRAVFLPQVAPEQGWDVDQTLTHLALKAGLGPDAWRRGARFQVFGAEVF